MTKEQLETNVKTPYEFFRKQGFSISKENNVVTLYNDNDIYITISKHIIGAREQFRGYSQPHYLTREQILEAIKIQNDLIDNIVS